MRRLCAGRWSWVEPGGPTGYGLDPGQIDMIDMIDTRGSEEKKQTVASRVTPPSVPRCARGWRALGLSYPRRAGLLEYRGAGAGETSLAPTTAFHNERPGLGIRLS